MELRPPDQLDAAAGNALGPDPGATASPAKPPTRVDLAADSAKLLADAALALFAIYAVVVAFEILPPRLVDPLWLLAASTSLVNAVSVPLAGVVFLHLAASIAPYTNWIHQRRQRVSRFATWAALGFLLLVPLLCFSTWRGITNVNSAIQKQSAGLTRNANDLLAAINNASSPQELQRSMVELQGPQLRNEDLAQPLPVLKKAGTQVVKQVLLASQEQLSKSDAKAYKPLYIQTLRTALLSLVSSIAFAAVAWDPLKQQSLLHALFAKTAYPKRNGLSQLIKKKLEEFKRSTGKDGSQSEVIALARQRQQESQKAKARHEREAKRNRELQRKAAVERDRKREQAERQAKQRRER